MLLAGVSTKRVAEQHRHLNRKETQTNRRNILRNFPLHGFNKHIPWFRCSGKGEYLNPAQTHNSEANQLTANALQDFQQLCPWFRSQTGLEYRGMQIRLGGTSGRGIHQTRNRTAQASEPKPNSKTHCNTLRDFSLHRFRKHISWFRCGGKVEHLNPAARQNPAAKPLTTNALQDFQQLHPRFRSQAGAGMPQIANVPRRCFWQGYPPNTQQNSPGI